MQQSNILAESNLTSLIGYAESRNFPQVVAVLIQTMESWGIPNDNRVAATVADKELYLRFWCKLFDKTKSSNEMARWACIVTAVVNAQSLGPHFAMLAAQKCDDITAAAQYVLTHESGDVHDTPKHSHLSVVR